MSTGPVSVAAAIVGDQSLLIHCVDLLRERGVEPVVIVSDAADIATWASEQQLPIVANGPGLADELAAYTFDYLFSITNLKLLPAPVLAMADRLAINFHDGPLPAYAGLHATTWSLLNREERHGVSWHTMEVGVDEGDLLSQVVFDVAPDETAKTLNVKCYEAAIASFAELVDDLLAGTENREPQDLSQRSYYGRYQRPAAAATLDWTRPVAELDALVRALDFGGYANPLARAKILTSGGVLVVEAMRIEPGSPTATPGTVLSIDGDEVIVAGIDGVVVLAGLVDPSGVPRSAARVAAAAGITAGQQLPRLDDDRAARLTELQGRLARTEPTWVAALADLSPVELPYLRRTGEVDDHVRVVDDIDLPPDVVAHLHTRHPEDSRARARHLAACFAAFMARLSGSSRFDLALDAPLVPVELGPWCSPQVPLRIEADPTERVGGVVETIITSIERAEADGPFLADASVRYPALSEVRAGSGDLGLPVGIELGGDPGPPVRTRTEDLTLTVDADGGGCALVSNTSAYGSDIHRQIHRQFAGFLAQLVADPHQPLGAIGLLSDDEYRRVVVDWNATDLEVEAATVHQLFGRTAAERAGQSALVSGDTSLTYDELDRRSSQLAHHLQGLGARPGSLVGLYMDRGADMIVGLLGVLKSGAAYVPLDPTYPADRIALMIEDSGLQILLTRTHLTNTTPAFDGEVVAIDGDWHRISAHPQKPPASTSGPDDLAYVIYTSGSTGRPKGVMVTHHNVVNFLAGMDVHIRHDDGDTWLTVTSLSFDISVLEICWSLTRGLELVVFADEAKPSSDDRPADAASASSKPNSGGRPIGFSLFYFASDESEAEDGQKYELLLEGAKFADRNGFEAVWTPERHFYAFGGLYPNPSVTGAAIAAVTDNVQIRAGSCVLPLHHPARVAEEWSVVDNISQGRVGVAFAAGWQPVDFLLRPENFADRKANMIASIEQVQRLWRGESLTFDSPTGPVDVRTLPRPVQPELPTWLTVAGNPDTFAAAGSGGHNVLTHLLGQSVEEVAAKIAIYRRARSAAGHTGDGRVTLMLHTYLDDDVDVVRERVRPSMIEYLRSSVDLIKEAAWSFPTFAQKADESGKTPADAFAEEDLSDDEMEALLEHAFNRYFEGSALFGTPESCRAMVAELQRIGVDEIACQVDFGLPTDEVLASLPLLDELRRSVAEVADGTADDEPVDGLLAQPATIPALLERHGVSHFQCTPSMGAMLIADEHFRRAATGLKVCLMGGEAFPQSLAKEITDIVDGTVLNVYGPTETTIWSSVHRVLDGDRPVSIGRPLANQQMYVVDANLEPCPVGVPGELLIGGDGVTRGYHDRPELTAERFIADRYRPDVAGAQLYRTGDLVRYDQDGSIDFLGRMDFQVKIRGYRIELGEIEARLDEHPSVREAVVVAREDTPGDQRLVAYLIATEGHQIDADELRQHLGSHLPGFMVPVRYVAMDRFPLTPNKKTDRKALPAPDETGVAGSGVAYVAPEQGPQQQLVDIWQDLLGVARVGVDDNFFDLGGHSLLAVQLNRRITAALGVELSITDVFRFPTIAALTHHLEHRDAAANRARSRVADRASARRQAMAGQRGRRRRRG